MIGRVVATAAAVVPVAATAIEKGARVATSTPLTASFFGYPFEVAGMIAALFGCIAARYWIGAGQAAKKAFRLQLDLPVSALTLGTTAGVIIASHLTPLIALLAGTGIGIVGEGLFKIAEKQAEALGFTAKGGNPPD